MPHVHVHAPEKLAELGNLVSRMSPRDRTRLLLSIGVPAEFVLGIDRCIEHIYGRPMGDAEPLTFDENSMWCRGCYRWVKVYK